MKITRISDKGIDLIKKYEGFSSKPYKCPAGIATIGYGSTYYSDGKKVSLSDLPINEQQATLLLKDLLKTFERAVDSFTRDDVNQNQFDALVSFAYNVGANALKNSNLMRLVNHNPSNPSIRLEFLKWNKSGGKILIGLTKRRTDEANLYFS